MVVNVSVQSRLYPFLPIFISKKIGAFLDCYILVYIRNCGVLGFLEFDDKWHGPRFRDIMNGDLNP